LNPGNFKEKLNKKDPVKMNPKSFKQKGKILQVKFSQKQKENLILFTFDNEDP
jgi:hypothetical protein